VSLESNDFYRDSHKRIFQAVESIREGGYPVDLITLSESLKNSGYLDQIGGPSYLGNLTDLVPSVAAMPHYCKIIIDHRKRRQAIEAAGNIAELAYRSAEIEDLTDAAQTAFYGIEVGQEEESSVSTLVSEGMKKLKHRIASGGGVSGISTGYVDLDRSLAGLHDSDLIILAARPSMGKTALAMNMVNKIAGSGVPVAVFSHEMSKLQLVDRMLSSVSRVPAHRIRSGYVSEENMGSIAHAAGIIAGSQIYIDDTPSMPVQEIRRRTRKMKKKYGIGLMVMDYMQLATSPKARSREQEISDISRQMKAIAKELNIPVMCLSQLNRSLEQRADKRPVLSDLRDSGQIEQDADVVMFIYRDEVYNKSTTDKGIAEIIIGKQRNGPTGRVKMAFLGETMTFKDLV
jgi:replicative DNA helicase